MERVRSIVERAAPQRVAAPVPVTTKGAYKFLHEVAGRPITYNPCRRIRYELNLDAAPAGSEAILGSAINEVERATGLRFEYVGTTHRKPLDKEPTRWRLGLGDAPPVVISWATESQAPMLSGRVAGYAGSSFMTYDGRRSHYVTGRVVLDADAYAEMVQNPAGSAAARAITMHELAHLVGLDHVEDLTEVMNSTNMGQVQFGPGDLAGLAQLGNGHC